MFFQRIFKYLFKTYARTVFALKKRILILFVVLASTSLMFLPLCRALASLTVYGYTDKTYYRLGDAGTLQFWVYNSGTEDLILKNITIYYPWYNPVGLWGGNITITPSTSTVIGPGGNWSDTSSFTVPNDGRISSGSSSININVVTDKTTQSSQISLSLASTPFYFVQNMDQLMTWLMILVAAIVVCTLIIVGAIFLSMRNLRTMETIKGTQ
jgi:uncharacterized membrane protein